MRVLLVTSLDSLSALLVVPDFSVKVLLDTSLDSFSDFLLSQISV